MDRPSGMHSRRQAQAGSCLWIVPARMVLAVVKWHGRRKALRELMALDDHLLKDIGFRRDEVLKALRSGGLPARIDWMSDSTSEANQRRGARCPTSNALAAGRPCSM